MRIFAVFASRLGRADNARYRQLDQESEKNPSNGNHTASSTPHRRRRRTHVVLAAVLTTILLSFLYFSPPSTGPLTSLVHHADRNTSHTLRLLIPASSPSPALCKTLFSAAALDYPTPYIINWDRHFDDPVLIFGGSHIAKIGGVLHALKTLPPGSDDDLVVLVDGYDIWFQLKPDVLVKRYLSITQHHDQRLADQFGSKAARDAAGVRQKVLFSAQKRCWPKEATHPACYAVPPSTLPPDVYGVGTDTNVDDEKNPYVKYRQRYLNSGAAIGPAAALSAIFERALEKAEKDKNIGSDQGIFAEIFGEQEYYRHVAAEESGAYVKKAKGWWDVKMGKGDRLKSVIDETSPPKDKILLPRPADRNYEFGLGLDYDMSIAQATVFSEYDTEWLVRDERDEIVQKYRHHSITEPYPALSPLPADMLASPPPFSPFTADPLVGRDPVAAPPRSMSWAGARLFTNLYTGNTPVAVHHNAHRDGLKGRIERHWDRPWFQGRLRQLLDAHAWEPVRPVARVALDGQGRVVEQDKAKSEGEDTKEKVSRWSLPGKGRGKVQVHEYWGPDLKRDGAESDKGPLAYQDICAGTEAEVMRDDKGPWKDPKHWP